MRIPHRLPAWAFPLALLLLPNVSHATELTSGTINLNYIGRGVCTVVNDDAGLISVVIEIIDATSEAVVADLLADLPPGGSFSLPHQSLSAAKGPFYCRASTGGAEVRIRMVFKQEDYSGNVTGESSDGLPTAIALDPDDPPVSGDDQYIPFHEEETDAVVCDAVGGSSGFVNVRVLSNEPVMLTSVRIRVSGSDDIADDRVFVGTYSIEGSSQGAKSGNLLNGEPAIVFDLLGLASDGSLVNSAQQIGTNGGNAGTSFVIECDAGATGSALNVTSVQVSGWKRASRDVLVELLSEALE